ncbi:hypothetical protein DOTSEDRAFT_170484 [Dothistroma septosporum NZE10]|uniref:Uncharacterized protein n=1 Tax=Dothistroma septosporum (strain NZE10 / CBS 128990) TaxID=675120 RepID=N1PS09_DOTSN|nr:hypothetical protein DOTSEDRAFT_170484 [Dothistroma septosporum NZE10]
MARRKGASRHTKVPVWAPSTGASEPNRSSKSVWSERLIRVSGISTAFAIAATSVVFPTPGLPSSMTGLLSCNALRTRMALERVV